MRYSANHKEKTRQKLIESSGALAKAGGFATTGVDGLMKAIGLTGGAFYSHFPSKADLLTEVVKHELSQSPIAVATRDSGLSREKLEHCLAQYMSMAHVNDAEGGCAIPALGAEIARGAPEVRIAAEQWMQQLHEAWAGTLNDDALAWALISQCVGALVVARMLAESATQAKVLEAGRAAAAKLMVSVPGD